MGPFKERAIILAKTKFGEADLILKFLTSRGEVFSAIAKSALKSKKRFGGGVLEPTHYVHVTINKKSNDLSDDKLCVLSEAQMIDDFNKLKSDYDRLTLAFHFVRVVATVAREGDLHREVFNLLGHALKAAETSGQLLLLKLRFDLKLLHLQGVLPPEERYYPLLRPSIREDFELSSDVSLSVLGSEIQVIYQNYL